MTAMSWPLTGEGEGDVCVCVLGGGGGHPGEGWGNYIEGKGSQCE
jgi:hypothetical protein